jgi:4-diphosphocytidyl-2-C-methyl-D-erythritol kinase
MVFARFAVYSIQCGLIESAAEDKSRAYRFIQIFIMLEAMESFTLPAFAKINWFLRVLGRRDDDFHELCTVFQTVSLHDRLTFFANDEILLTCDDSKIPTDQRNLIYRAAISLRERFGIKQGARIYLEKRIPAPGGLGGGSSDAAIALLGLAKLWRIEVTLAEFCEIGSVLGSDVPYFFHGGTALGTGRGTEVLPVQEIDEKYMLIVTPAAMVPTQSAFAGLNAPRLTNQTAESILKICRIEAEKLNLRHSDLKNDFEQSVFRIEPEIKRVKKKLLESGAARALMSGSGASVFAVFDKEETRQATLKALEVEINWRKFAVTTVARDEYRAALRNLVPEVVSD